MRGWTVYFVALLFAMQAVPLVTQERAAQAREKPKPTFALSIEVDNDAARVEPDLHSVLVRFTRTAIGVEVEQFHEEAKGMYEMIVMHNGVPAKETDAMRDLRAYRKIDSNPTIRKPRLLKDGESWITTLDVSDYYDMTKPGTYQITVTRESQPENPLYRVLVSSNTLAIVVQQNAGRQSVLGAEKPKPRFALDLSAEGPDDVPPQSLRVELDNTSNRVIRERTCSSFMGMYNLVVFRDGVPLEANDVMRRLQKSRAAVDCPANEAVIEIEPGDSYADSVNIRGFYNVFQPGGYMVYVTREAYPYNPAKSVVVESNALSFVVPEPPAAAATPTADDPPSAPQ